MDAPLYSDWLPRDERDSDLSDLDMTQFDLVVIERKPGSLLFRMLPKDWRKQERGGTGPSAHAKNPETEHGQPDSEAGS